MKRCDIPFPDIAIEITPNPQNLAVIRHFICTWARELGLSDESALQLELCVDEACANSVEALLRDGFSSDILCVRIEMKVTQEAFHVLVQDCGKDYSLAFEKAAPLHEFSDRTRKRGYGLQIIKTFMDDVHYEHDLQEGNKLLFIKYFIHEQK